MLFSYSRQFLSIMRRRLDAWRITTDDLPIPFSPALEDAFLPSADSVAEAVRRRLGVAVAG
jgi:hypothetical protein